MVLTRAKHNMGGHSTNFPLESLPLGFMGEIFCLHRKREACSLAVE